MKYLLLLGIVFSANAMADLDFSYEDEISIANDAINAPTLNIEGSYQTPAPAQQAPAAPAKKKLTPSEKMKMRRARLELRNKIMMERKMEQIRMQQEIALAKQLEQQMNKTLKAIDSIN